LGWGDGPKRKKNVPDKGGRLCFRIAGAGSCEGARKREKKKTSFVKAKLIKINWTTRKIKLKTQGTDEKVKFSDQKKN